MTRLKALALCGSLRTGSYNRMLLELAKRFASSAGAAVDEFDLKKAALPMYDGDIEALGFPEPVRSLKDAVAAADVFLIASPEYNYSVPGVLKNAIDWASRGENNSWGGKTAAIFGATDGVYGTVRAQFQLRQILACVNVLILPQPQVFVCNAQEAFDVGGMLKDKKLEERLRRLMEKTLKITAKLK